MAYTHEQICKMIDAEPLIGDDYADVINVRAKVIVHKPITPTGIELQKAYARGKRGKELQELLHKAILEIDPTLKIEAGIASIGLRWGEPSNPSERCQI